MKLPDSSESSPPPTWLWPPLGFGSSKLRKQDLTHIQVCFSSYINSAPLPFYFRLLQREKLYKTNQETLKPKAQIRILISYPKETQRPLLRLYLAGSPSPPNLSEIHFPCGPPPLPSLLFEPTPLFFL